VSSTIDVRVPDIGDFKDIPVIEVFVKPGDTVKKNDSLVTLESDKAAMEVPSSADGKVADVKVKLGDKVSEGTVIVTLESTAAPADKKATDQASSSRAEARSAEVEGQLPSGSSATVELVVPDVGDFENIPVIEVLIKPGDTIAKEASLIVLESDKASMEVPSTAAGVVQDVKLKVGDKVSKGTVIATLATTSATPANAPVTPANASSGPSTSALRASAQDDGGAATAVGGAGTQLSSRAERSEVEGQLPSSAGGVVHASPSIRRFARELGVALQSLRGSGPNGRITREDVQRYVKSALQSGVASAGAAAGGGFAFAGLPAWPKVDFAQYGEIERVPLSRIKKLSGPNLHRNWVQIPHITNYDEADVTDLEAFRNEVNAERAKAGGAKLTMLAFLVKASVAALQKFPDFNSSLDGDALVHKQYYNIGFAADTPNGLVVPVLKNAQSKGLLEVAQESSDLAAKARDGKLALGDMQGGTFTISSIGGIGGTAFTQIVNAPEVAILGATRAAIKPVWNGKEFAPRLMLPISVSYDHRVIDGASAARFLVYLTGLLKDFRRTAL
jgi:pyruvate dehydrogenase E2 component (dihydrolipoamide acetyltransferase)